MCLRHHSDVEVSVNHSKDCHKFSNAEVRRVKYIKKKVYFKESKIQSELKELSKI